MLSLIVNPSSGGGRAARALPSVRAALGRHGLEHHVELTLDLAHARSLARDAVAAGEMPVAYGGDGLVAAVADAVRETGAVIGRPARRPRQRLCALPRAAARSGRRHRGAG